MRKRNVTWVMALSAAGLVCSGRASADELRCSEPGAHASCHSGGRGSFELNPPERPWAVRAQAEFGALSVLYNRIQYGRQGNTFNYVKEGGQNNLFPFLRLSAEGTWMDRHTIVFLYQPLDLRTETRVRRDLRVEDVVFGAGSNVNLRYGFEFYRVSYLYDLLPGRRQELGIGAGLQIRNAAISFTSVDGTQRVSNSGIGPVPLLKIRGRNTLSSGAFLGFEIDGSYARSLNSSNSTDFFEGMLLDVSLRAGVPLTGPLEAFVNLRYLGGGAKSQNPPEDPTRDRYTSNWLHTLALSIGGGFR